MKKSLDDRVFVEKRLIVGVSLLFALVVGAPAAHAQMCSEVCHADSACGTSCLLDNKVCTVGWNASDSESMDPDGTSKSCPDESAYDTTTWSSCSAYSGWQCGLAPVFTQLPDPIDLGNLICPPAAGIDVNKARSKDDSWAALAGGVFYGGSVSANASDASWSGGVNGGYRMKIFSSDWSDMLRGEVSMNVKYYSDRPYDVTIPWSLKLFQTIVYSGAGTTVNQPSVDFSSWDLQHVDRTNGLSKSVEFGTYYTWLGPVQITVRARATFGATVTSAATQIVDPTSRTKGSYIQLGPTATLSATCTASADIWGLAGIGVDGTVNLVSGSLATRVFVFGEGDPLLTHFNVKWYHDWSAELRFVEGKFVAWIRILFKKWTKDLFKFGPAAKMTWAKERDAGCAKFAAIDATVSQCSNAQGLTACQGGCGCTTCRNSLGLLVDCPATCTTACPATTPAYCYMTSGSTTDCNGGCGCTTCYNAQWGVIGCPSSCATSCGAPAYCYDSDWQDVWCQSLFATYCYDSNWFQVPCHGAL